MLNKKFLSTASVVLVVGLLVTAQSSAAMIDLGDPGDIWSKANHVSSDGLVVTGQARYGDNQNAFKYVGTTKTDLGTLGGTLSSDLAVSADGLVIVGCANLANGDTHAFKYVGNTMIDLGTLGGNFSYAHAISVDGTVIVGSAQLANGNSRAFKYVGTTMTDLGTLGGNNSSANAVSADGTVIIGASSLANGNSRAFKYVGNTMTDLGTLGGNQSFGEIISADGSVIIGTSNLANGDWHAFKYVGTTMTDLGTLGGNESGFYEGATHSISADGSVIVGRSSLANGNTHAFKYVGTTMYDIGTLGGLNSYARAISADGSVIVGHSNLANGNEHAFKYVGTTMTDLGTLGGSFSSAADVSADGTVIVGSAQLANGDNHAFVYTESGMLDTVEWMQSISGPAGILPMVNSLTSLPMEGAHHRPLMSLDGMGKKSQSWVTGDFGARSRTSDSHTSSGEAGVSSTFGRVMAGLAVGYSEQNNDLLFGGSSNISGQYILGEVDMRLSDNKSILSVTTMLGNWKSNTLRGYGTGSGVDYSLGSTSLNSTSIRLRIDGAPHKLIRGPWITPFASFTWSRTSADAYDENGGSYDAHFNRQSHISKEGRLGVSTNFKLGKDTTLLTTLEWIHRFDKSESGFSGTDIDHGALPFDVAGAAIHSNQARLGIDVDHKLNPTTMLNFSAHITSVGEAPDVSSALSLRRAF
jgi:probable HAF family extracellular repeat protein